MDAEQRARELLATEAESGGWPRWAAALREGRTDSIDQLAIRAITRALTQAQPGWRVVPWKLTPGMAEAGRIDEADWLCILAAAPAPQQGEVEAPAYTTGHCESHKLPGGCPHHNLQCGWPECDRRPVAAAPKVVGGDDLGEDVGAVLAAIDAYDASLKEDPMGPNEEPAKFRAMSLALAAAAAHQQEETK